MQVGDFEIIFNVDIKWLHTVKTNRSIDIFVRLLTLQNGGKEI